MHLLSVKKIDAQALISFLFGLHPLARQPDEFAVADEIAEPEIRHAALLSAEKFTGTAQREIRFCDAKSVRGLLQHREPSASLFIGRSGNQDAMRISRAA